MLKKSLISALILGSVLITCFLYCKRDNSTTATNVDCPEFKVTDNTVSVSIAAKPDLFNPFLTSSSYARQIMDIAHRRPVRKDYSGLGSSLFLKRHPGDPPGAISLRLPVHQPRSM